MGDYCNQSKADYSGIQDRALGARYVRYDAQTNRVCALSITLTHISAWIQLSIFTYIQLNTASVL